MTKYVEVRFEETINQVMREAASCYEMSPEDLTIHLAETIDDSSSGRALRILWEAVVQANENCSQFHTRTG